MTRAETLQLLHDSGADLSKWSIRHRYGRGDVLYLHVSGGSDIMLGEIGPDQPEQQAYVEAYLRHCRGSATRRVDTAKWYKAPAGKGSGRSGRIGSGEGTPKLSRILGRRPSGKSRLRLAISGNCGTIIREWGTRWSAGRRRRADEHTKH